jgi:hypothetical protein
MASSPARSREPEMMAASESRMWCPVFSATAGGSSRVAAAEMYSESARVIGVI